MTEAVAESVAIVGGGIAGLFCALVLKEQQRSFTLFEASNRLGGRIRTIRLNKENKSITHKWRPEDLEFYAEFGPMRIELDKQLLLKTLLHYLGIQSRITSQEIEEPAYLRAFPAYTSPTSTRDPQYELRPEEIGKTPLQLLRLALLRILVRTEVSDQSSFSRKRRELVDEITLAAATHESADPVFLRWMKRLTSEDYWEIQTLGCIDQVPLYAIGFWNLLSDHLSHDAITKLRDLGTFYHLLPENPNAAEWLVWWLVGFAISEQLQGIFGGMECIVDNLRNRIDGLIKTGCRVTTIEITSSKKLKLLFAPNHGLPVEITNQEYDRIILALPKTELERITRESKAAFACEPDISGLLDSAFGFPMVKLFIVVKNRWWEEESRANRYATRIPTRELHYWKGLTRDSKQGLIMVYTDRPASSFWANYVPPAAQYDATISSDNPLPSATAKRLVRKVVQYINENEVDHITEEDIVWYGIRDWGREPYGGANHAWRPERRFWVVMRRLGEIRLPETGDLSSSGIYICNEAYSDYHGFMEGSLRSAVYALHRILDKNADGSYRPPVWLIQNQSATTEHSLQLDQQYFHELSTWVDRLDKIDVDAPFLYTEL